MTFDYRAQRVLITGASSGIGRAFALELASRGATVVIVARRLDRLRALESEIERRFGGTVLSIPLDVGAPDAADRLTLALADHDLRITSLINCAGFGTFGLFQHEDQQRLAEEVAVDVNAPVQITAALLPQILSAGEGFIVNVASMAAYMPTPRMAVYGAAKAFILSFSESLWAELRGTGVLAFALSPGATATEFNAVTGTDDATSGRAARTPEQVVATALRHLEARDPGPSVIDGAGNRLGAAAGRFAGRRSAVAMMERLTDPARRRP